MDLSQTTNSTSDVFVSSRSKGLQSAPIHDYLQLYSNGNYHNGGPL
jgi:hypothetical protein